MKTAEEWRRESQRRIYAQPNRMELQVQREVLGEAMREAAEEMRERCASEAAQIIQNQKTWTQIPMEIRSLPLPGGVEAEVHGH